MEKYIVVCCARVSVANYFYYSQFVAIDAGHANEPHIGPQLLVEANKVPDSVRWEDMFSISSREFETRKQEVIATDWWYENRW